VSHINLLSAVAFKFNLSRYNKGGAAAYSALGHSGFLKMPSVSTLKRLVRGSEQHPGIVHSHIHRIKQAALDLNLKGSDREMTLAFDEIHIQEGLSWKVHKRKNGEIFNELVGFGDATDAKLSSPDSESGFGALSNKVLQYMVRGVTGKFSMPVAYFPFRKSSHIRLHETFWQVMRCLNAIDLPVHMVGSCPFMHQPLTQPPPLDLGPVPARLTMRVPWGSMNVSGGIGESLVPPYTRGSVSLSSSPCPCPNPIAPNPLHR